MMENWFIYNTGKKHFEGESAENVGLLFLRLFLVIFLSLVTTTFLFTPISDKMLICGVSILIALLYASTMYPRDEKFVFNHMFEGALLPLVFVLLNVVFMFTEEIGFISVKTLIFVSFVGMIFIHLFVTNAYLNSLEKGKIYLFVELLIFILILIIIPFVKTEFTGVYIASVEYLGIENFVINWELVGWYCLAGFLGLMIIVMIIEVGQQKYSFWSMLWAWRSIEILTKAQKSAGDNFFLFFKIE